MTKILACIDGSSAAPAVCDAATWASLRLDAPLTLLHVLDRSEYPVKGDLSGNIGLGSREHLLDELVSLDEKRGRLALEHGKHLLESAKIRTEENGAERINRLQRHGNLIETLQEMEPDTRLLVMGRQGEAHENSAHSIGSHLESVVRTLHRPILVVLPDFTQPRRFMIAFDGSSTAKKALEMVGSSPLLQGLDCHIVMVCNSTADTESELDAACNYLAEKDFNVIRTMLSGEIVQTLRDYQKEHGIDLMVMGAYGHSRIRQFLVGSNTTKMVSSSDIPLLLLR